ncbi:phox-associated domain,Sorting nexin [Artemisia annua]|uniref:Phox-associated domain,Sorting nexin n=1 Tax=Artemisia annua TaxID=35608 RepID=A0A2U1M853_ARTAN|nr:phox-associated domain,Sorting nexin [Artemisia annua]
MSSSVRQSVTVRDLIDESKKRLVLLAVCGVGLSYLMSLTSASVLINLPAALFLIVGLRYFALDYEMRRKAAVYNSNPSSTNLSSQKKPAMAPKPLSGKSDWRRKVNSPVVEDAIDQFTKHIVSEWVTDLWYSRVTPDKQGPDELVLIINGVLGEFSSRMRNINLIDLLTRDIIKLFCTHLELFRACQMKITKQQSMTIAQRDVELKAVLYSENKLHPALFSPGAEHKVLQHLMDGFISFTFRHEDLQCSLFRYIVREMLACAVIRPVVNLANPRFINERIENVVISASKNNKIITNEQMNSQPKSNGSPKLSNQPSMLIDPSVKGVELTQLKKDNSDSVLNNVTAALHSKDPLLSIDTRKQLSGGEWGDKLDIISRRKAEVLAPEHFENMWAKGKDYKTKENVKHFTEPVKNSLARSSNPVNHSKPLASHKDAYGPTKGTKVWDGKNNRKNSVTYIHHPLESYEGQKMRKTGKDYSTGRKRSRVSSQKDVWLEIERKSFLLEDGLDVLGSSKGHSKSGDSSGDSEGGESLGRTNSGTSTSSFFPAISTNNVQKGSSLDDSFFRLRCEVLGANIVKSGSKTFAVYPISVTDVNNVSWSIKRRFRHFEELHRRLKEYPEYNLHLPPKHFLSTGLDVDVIQERCKLLDIYLKRLMQFPTISGCIEVWDFLSVDSQTYSFSNSISIIETLSVNSAANVRERSTEVGTTGVGFAGDPLTSRRELSDGVIKNSLSEVKNSSLTDGSKASKKNAVSSLGKPVKRSEDSDSDHEIVVPSNISSTIKSGQFVKGLDDNTLSKQSGMLAGDGDSIPSEWVPPNLSIPMFDLVDVVFQLQDGGWIRRKVFWVAKQVLQLGMSDAFDDWLIAKIQLLRRGSIVASGIKRLEQILWPDGIFITKHPKRQQPTPTPRVPQVSPNGQQPPSPGGHPPSDEETLSPEELQEREARRRSKLVYELMIDKAPAAVVSIFGRKEYEQCVQDVYYFIQSSVCLKQLAFDLLELLLMSAFPEMDSVFQQLQDEKQKFGVLEQ